MDQESKDYYARVVVHSLTQDHFRKLATGLYKISPFVLGGDSGILHKGNMYWSRPSSNYDAFMKLSGGVLHTPYTGIGNVINLTGREISDFLEWLEDYEFCDKLRAKAETFTRLLISPINSRQEMVNLFPAWAFPNDQALRTKKSLLEDESLYPPRQIRMFKEKFMPAVAYFKSTSLL